MRATVAPLAPVELDGALVVVAFPTTGSAAAIAGHYLLRHLKLPLVADVRGADLHSVMAVTDGIATSAVRIHGGEVACRLDRNCPRIYMVITELTLPPATVAAVADAVLEWAQKGNAHMVLALEAVVRGEGDTTPDVFCAAGTPDVLKTLVKTGVPAMERALIGGMTSHLVLPAASRKVRAGTFLVEASRDHPDGRAAAALVEAFGRLVPDVKMDAKPLLKEAMELEEQIQQARREATHQAEDHPAAPQFI